MFPCKKGKLYADVAQSVAHILGKDEVTGPIPVISSNEIPLELLDFTAFSRGFLILLVVYALTQVAVFYPILP